MELPREIERKFLVDPERLPPDFHSAESEAIDQGYLVIDGSAEREVRLRRRGEKFRLTVKSGSGSDRGEGEIDLSREQFDTLWPFTGDRRLHKRRHSFPLAHGLTVEVDVYEGTLEGLVVAEVEFADRDAAQHFQPPSWFGREVTGDASYKNQQLAGHGVPPGEATRGE